MTDDNNSELQTSPAEMVEPSPNPDPAAPSGPALGNPSGFKTLSANILIAALLISGSVFYNANLILKKLDSWQAQNSQSGVLGANTAAVQLSPDAPVKVSDRQDEPVIGNPRAGLAIYEFSDFQCPFCTQFFKQTYPEIKSKYINTGKAKLIYRHFPLSFHQNAEKAAEAAECANRQGKFESYFDALFSNSKADGKGLEVADLRRYAVSLGLDLSAFNKCLDNGEAAKTIKDDIAEGSALGVEGTPTFIIGGKKIVGAQPFASFAQAIDAALK